MLKQKHADLSEPGDFSYASNSSDEVAGLCIKCPGCGAESYLQFANTATTVEHGSKWSWDGNRIEPTLSPSVHSVGCCGWHGYLRNGKWESC